MQELFAWAAGLSNPQQAPTLQVPMLGEIGLTPRYETGQAHRSQPTDLRRTRKPIVGPTATDARGPNGGRFREATQKSRLEKSPSGEKPTHQTNALPAYRP